MKHKQALNILGFNVAWLGLVVLGNAFIPVALLFLLLHLRYLSVKAHELTFILVFSFIGMSIDTLLSFTGIFIFSQTPLIPLWLCVLWILFAATINHSLAFLSKHHVWQYLLGAIFGPLSYIAGFNLGSVGFRYSSEETFLILSIIWGPCLFLCFYLNHNISRLYKTLRKDHA